LLNQSKIQIFGDSTKNHLALERDGVGTTPESRSTLLNQSDGAASGHCAYFTGDDDRLRHRLPAFAAAGFTISRFSFEQWDENACRRVSMSTALREQTPS
jgi:hypothetical protein